MRIIIDVVFGVTWILAIQLVFFLEIFEGIRDTDIRLNFDTGNIVAYGDDPIPVLTEAIDKVETVHVSDIEEDSGYIFAGCNRNRGSTY